MSPDPARLHRLLVRYWDHTLTDAEAAELFAALRADPAAQDLLQAFSLEAMAAADGSVVAPGRLADPAPLLTRRRLLGMAGLTAAVGAVGLRWWPDPADALRVVSVRGVLKLLVAGAREPVVGSVIPSGGTVATDGIGSAAVLAYPDGTTVSLASDSIVTLTGLGRRLLLRKGAVSAEVPDRAAGAGDLVLTTAEAVLSRLAGASLTLGSVPLGDLTEFGVHRGRVVVTGPSGAALGEVASGELLTVLADGRCDRQPIPTAPGEYAWTPARPSPPAWAVGKKAATPDGPVVRAAAWDDPDHEAPRYRVQSDARFVRGLFRLDPDAVVRVRYRAARPGAGRLAVAVRTLDSSSPESGTLEWSGPLAPGDGPGGWRWLEAQAGAMTRGDGAPRFDPPWVGFQIILDTGADDLGLELAEIRVTPPGR